MNGCLGWLEGLWPGGVVGAFDVPFGHFAFDDVRVGSLSAGGVESPAEFSYGVGPAAVRVVRGKSRPRGRWSGE